jgi:hypothetical protein
VIRTQFSFLIKWRREGISELKSYLNCNKEIIFRSCVYCLFVPFVWARSGQSLLVPLVYSW